MAKKKGKQPATEDKATSDPVAVRPARPSAPSKKSTGSSSDAAPALIICRNKHWRYISSFHGPWLQMPIEILETIANINYNTPRPRPVDPAVLFDLLKIRRLVDEATNLAVRAASDIASPMFENLHTLNGHSASSLGFGLGGGHGTKLSRERKFRMREQASQKLARAYRLDEIACSVATMQGASTLEEIGALVLQRNPGDPDAKYVHFFHEKIPSRQLAESTSLEPLADIIEARPNEAEAWRTRATVKIFKEDHEGAAMDLSHALQICRFHHLHPSLPPAISGPLGGTRRAQDVILADEQRPSSLETQILFQRAGVYLTMACQHVYPGLIEPLPPLPGEIVQTQWNGQGPNTGHASSPGASPVSDKDTSRRLLENRKLVKTMAKRALRDYIAFLSHFDYCPDLPLKITREFTDKVNMAVQGNRNPRIFDTNSLPEYKAYVLSDLFAAVPPADLPPYPAQELVLKNDRMALPQLSNEAITYHPLLTDALHSLLLCHCLVQTSAKELQRHAYMVARLTRLADGYPVFQASRSPARADWLEVLRRANNWIQITSSWEQLCAPAPLPPLEEPFDSQALCRSHHPAPELAAAAASTFTTSGNAPSSASDTAEAEEEKRRERIRQQAIMESLGDDRVVDEASFRASVVARQARAEEDYKLLKSGGGSSSKSSPREESGSLLVPASTNGNNGQSQQANGPPSAFRRWSVDDGREYPILTERAAAVSRWVLEAPVGAGATKRKKKKAPATNTTTTAGKAGTVSVEKSGEEDASLEGKVGGLSIREE